MKRYYFILVPIIALIQCFALRQTARSSEYQKAEKNNSDISSQNFFACATENPTPTLYAYTSGKTSLTPLISWHQEYLLPQDSGSTVCQQVAEKLQYLYQEPGQKYISTQEEEGHTLVCTVKIENDTCGSNNSEPLFTVNPNYDAKCILDRKEPLECVVVGRARGVFSVPDSPYKPIWWLW
ncbi:hypothetical protein Xen7305DRAFT_00012340 [Xenococcus sp. PCC 7305]|uniref:COP23 domain-containing protein n=1 Tax=Xenococcus sp. PCC 7305 TaxID=102125 RepID=UPI0002AC1104|nr:COP23 domain-containing protein [Xenococcus sp. PCC 7305]ELS01530.1 hypothetical protein Xen7305DRAFT_00012340 [Xenococcus sp. PCC 7305]